MMINKLIAESRELGACGLAEGCTGWRSLNKVLFSPQGREFCKVHEFPSRQEWIAIKQEIGNSIESVLINAGEITVRDRHQMAIIGETSSEVYCAGNSRDYLILVQHGARVCVHASDYAVVRIERLSKDVSVIIDSDKSAIIL